MENLFIGIDLSKDTFDCCILNGQNRLICKNRVFSNSREGIADFIALLTDFEASSLWVCMEHTGVYGDLLCSYLSAHGLNYCLLNPMELKYSMGLIRGKTDAIDAYRIALYARRHAPELQPHQLAEKALQKLGILMSQRKLFVKIKAQLMNRLAALKVSAGLLDLSESVQLIEQSIQHHGQAIKAMDQQMKDLIKASVGLKKAYDKITQVIGVGPVTAIMCLVKTANFTKFTDPRKFCCYCGLAPFKHESGSSIRGKTRTSSRADKPLKTILLSAVSSAIQHDPQLKAYYKRKLKEGKNKFSVRNAIANKLVLRIFAVAKRAEPFVKLAA